MAARVLPLPRTLFLLTCTTLVLSAAIFVLGMLDLGTVSFWLNIAAAGITLLHDGTLLHYARRARPRATPAFFAPAASAQNVLFLLVCAFVYAAGLAMTAFSAHYAADGEISWGTPTNMGTIVAQAVLGGVNVVLLLWIALWCVRSRKTGLQYGYSQF